MASIEMHERWIWHFYSQIDSCEGLNQSVKFCCRWSYHTKKKTWYKCKQVSGVCKIVPFHENCASCRNVSSTIPFLCEEIMLTECSSLACPFRTIYFLKNVSSKRWQMMLWSCGRNIKIDNVNFRFGHSAK